MYRSVKRILQFLQRNDPALLTPVERILAARARRCGESNPRLLSVIAAPRSGSTLLFQLVTHAYQVGYVSNLEYFFYRYPFVGRWLRSALAGHYCSDFRSEYGFVDGLRAPAEANEFWRHCFGLDLHGSPAVADPGRARRGFEYLACVASCDHRPFATGWVGHVFYVDWLREHFPGTFFIVLRRDTAAVGLSLLNARRRFNRGDGAWFSSRPPECMGQFDDIHHEVAAQAYHINKRIDEHARTVNRHGDGLLVRYEELCENPLRTVEAIRTAYETWSATPLERSPLPLPPRFQRSRTRPEHAADHRRIQAWIARMEED